MQVKPITRVCAVLALSLATASAQTHTTIRHHKVASDDVAPQVAQAESAIDQKNYGAAESLLSQDLKANARDFRAWFDLGLIYGFTQRSTEAVNAYRKSLEIKPDSFETNLNLGLVQAGMGDADQAAESFRVATKLAPSNPVTAPQGRFIAWYSLAQVTEQSAPEESAAAYQKAAELQPANFDVQLGLAHALERAKRLSEAQAAYEKALTTKPDSEDALRGLVNVDIGLNQLPEAEKQLRKYVSINPESPKAHLDLARLLSKQGNYSDALAELQTAQKLAPQDDEIAAEIAGNAALAKQYDVAEKQYQALVQRSPNNADLHFALGTVLMDEKKYPQAEPELVAAVRLNPKMAEAYGNLANCADADHQYQLVIKVLDARGRIAPETPGTFFLRATSYDHLRLYKEATENYKMFLTTDNGRFPDQEWQARHRLIAIDPHK